MAIRPEQVAEAGAIQKAAAADNARCVRLVAGPGTGKSFSIEERVCWLLANGARPSAIAAVSFTRASAADLQTRVQQACERAGHQHADVPVTTLHSLALRSLKASGALEVYDIDPLVLDQWELKNVFDSEFGSVAGIRSVPRRRQIREDHEAFWSTGRHVAPPSAKPPDPPISDRERRRFRAFHLPRTGLYACVLPGELVQRCVQQMDAGTLDPTALLGIDHLIVDEFQDLNPMDLRFVYGLHERGSSLFVAGDDDQSLYAFRYASPEGIQRFTERFEAAGDHVLKHCFRCTPKVLSAAESLIESFSAPGRIAKDHVSLYADADPSVEGGFGCWKFDDGADEAEAIAASCGALIEQGLPAREIMVLLSNTRALGWQLAKAFEDRGVPYEPPRETMFRDTLDGRALLTLLRLIGGRQDYVALRTLLALRQGVGVKTAADIGDATLTANINYRSIFYDPLPPDVFTGRSERALSSVRPLCEELLDWSPEEEISDREQDIDRLLPLILGKPLASDWRAEIEPLPDEATLQEVARFIGASRDGERAKIIANVCTRLGMDAEPETTVPDRVRFMSMHGAKGLSATIVFIPGLEEQILPGPTRARYQGQVLEGARMLYVSITRARLGCIVSFAQSRFMNGQGNVHTPSRYAPHLGGTFTDGGRGLTARIASQTVDASKYL